MVELNTGANWDIFWMFISEFIQQKIFFSIYVFRVLWTNDNTRVTCAMFLEFIPLMLFQRSIHETLMQIHTTFHEQYYIVLFPRKHYNILLFFTRPKEIFHEDLSFVPLSFTKWSSSHFIVFPVQFIRTKETNGAETYE